MVGNEVCFDVDRSTPISSEKIAVIDHKGIVFNSEFCIRVKINRKDWKNTEAIMEIGNENNAKEIFKYCKKIKLNIFSQMIG